MPDEACSKYPHLGGAHHLAAGLAIDYFPDAVPVIEWLQSPSASCVLNLFPPDAGLQNQLEHDLRAHHGLLAYAGDDPADSETIHRQGPGNPPQEMPPIFP